jgi:tyrosine-protein kinase Etk/Wzc
VEESAHLIDLIRVLFKWRKPTALFFCGVVAAALIYCLVTPNEYTARATLMPGSSPGETGDMQNMAGSVLNRLGLSGVFRAPTINPADVFANTLRSRFLLRNVVRKMGLVEVFKIKDASQDRALEKAVDELLKRSSVDVSDMLLITVEVTDENPQLAADIANAFLDELDKANQQFSLSSAKKAREFVEERLDETEKSLVGAQDELTKFQEENGAIALDEQSKATVEAVARVEGEILALEAQRDALSATHTSAYSKVREMDLQIQAMRDKVRTLTRRDAASGGGAKDKEVVPQESLSPEVGVFIPLGDVPSISAEYARLLLDVKTQEKVFEILVGQHEELKIEEAKNVPTIQVLDLAFPPIEKSKPFRTVIMVVAIFVGLVGSLGLALLLNYFEAEFDEKKLRELDQMRRTVVRDVISRLPGRQGVEEDNTRD